MSNGLSRRDFVRVGGLSALGVGLPELLRMRAACAAETSISSTKRSVLIWLDGGPPHLETFDVKPDPPSEVRGPFQSIATANAGIRICELLPELAKRSNDLAIVRSVTSPLGEHNFGTHYLLTGYKPTPALVYPAVGAVVAHLRQQNDAVLPAHIAAPRFRVGGGRFDGQGFLGPAARPFSVGADPAKPGFGVADLDFYPGLDQDRLERRRRFVKSIEAFERGSESGSMPDDPHFEQAFRLVTSPKAKAAFDLSEETDATRNRYGRKSIGQCCLLARRLVERGVPFVTVTNPGWDTHQDAYTRLKEGFAGARVPVGLVPSLDLAVSGLIDDLRDRRLLDDTLIMVMGEFGRTPKLNTSGGRDHWPRVFSVLFAGGGVPGGQVVGSRDAVGEGPKDQPVTPADLAATTYRLLGISPKHLLHTTDGRPVKLSAEGKEIRELVG